MSTEPASAAQIDAHLNALADQIDHGLPNGSPRAVSPLKNRGYRVLLVVTGAGPTGDKTAAAAAARARLEKGRSASGRGSGSNRAA